MFVIAGKTCQYLKLCNLCLEPGHFMPVQQTMLVDIALELLLETESLTILAI